MPKKPFKSIDNNYELPSLLLGDKNLSLPENQDTKMLLMSIANIFESSLASNILLDSIELNDKYPDIPLTDWRKFMSNPLVKKFINGFMEERTEKRALRQLSTEDIKPSDALKIKQDIAAQHPKDYNQNIVIVFMPKKEYKI